MNDFLRLLNSEARKILHRERGIMAVKHESDVQYIWELRLIKAGATWGYDQGWIDAGVEIKRLQAEIARIDWRKG